MAVPVPVTPWLFPVQAGSAKEVVSGGRAPDSGALWGRWRGMQGLQLLRLERTVPVSLTRPCTVESQPGKRMHRTSWARFQQSSLSIFKSLRAPREEKPAVLAAVI